jgi:hypothetical protein
VDVSVVVYDIGFTIIGKKLYSYIWIRERICEICFKYILNNKGESMHQGCVRSRPQEFGSRKSEFFCFEKIRKSEIGIFLIRKNSEVGNRNSVDSKKFGSRNRKSEIFKIQNKFKIFMIPILVIKLTKKWRLVNYFQLKKQERIQEQKLKVHNHNQ